jgi:hypothetical protein
MPIPEDIEEFIEKQIKLMISQTEEEAQYQFL